MPATMLRVWPIRARGRDRPAMGMDWHTFQVPPYVGLGIELEMEMELLGLITKMKCMRCNAMQSSYEAHRESCLA